MSMMMYGSSRAALVSAALLRTTTRSTAASRSQAQSSSRQYWQEVVRYKIDPQTGNRHYERPSQTATRAVENMGHDDSKRQAKRVNYQEYEKPWMKRKRLRSQRIYGRKKKQVVELTKYVHYVNDYQKSEREREQQQSK